MTTYAYIRVSSIAQSIDRQLDEITRRGIDEKSKRLGDLNMRCLIIIKLFQKMHKKRISTVHYI